MTATTETPGWSGYYDEEDPDAIHIMPNFGREHVALGTTCWCPVHRDEEQPLLIIHELEQ